MPLNFEDALSPAAYKIACAVWEACEADEFSDCTFDSFFPLVAAALRAVADNVVPEAANAVGDQHDAARLDQWLRIRWKILSIATELENQ